MRRRSFLQYILGVFGIGVTGLPKTAKSTDVIVANETEPVQEWAMPEYMDFAPDTIVGVEKYQGKLLVFCEHSVWIIEENCYSDGLHRKLLSTIGCKDNHNFNAEYFNEGNDK